jgi:hypothetical protein
MWETRGVMVSVFSHSLEKINIRCWMKTCMNVGSTLGLQIPKCQLNCYEFKHKRDCLKLAKIVKQVEEKPTRFYESQ